MCVAVFCVAVLVLLFYIYMARRIIQVVRNGTTKTRRQPDSRRGGTRRTPSPRRRRGIHPGTPRAEPDDLTAPL